MAAIGLTSDLDKGGNSFQRVRVYRGPSLGWVETYVKPALSVTSGGTTTLSAGASIVLVNFAGAVTINLPKASAWFAEAFARPNPVFENAIYIKDFGGNAAANNITVHPFAGDKIDNLAQDFTIVQNRQLLRLYPMNDLTGWFSG